jgi:hypothetical protein
MLIPHSNTASLYPSMRLLFCSTMHDIPSLTSPARSPTSQWKRARPVTARTGSLGSINTVSALRPQGLSPSSPQIGRTASLGAYAPSRQASTVRDVTAFKNQDMEASLSGALRAMQLEDSTRASPSTSAMHPGLEHHVPVTARDAEETMALDSTLEQRSLYMDGPALQNDPDDVPNQDTASDMMQQKHQKEDEEVEEHSTLGYQIPEYLLRAAMLASPNTRASFWSAKLYRGPNGESLSTHYCTTMEVAERVARKFLNEKVVGFDIEWKPHSYTNRIKENASLIQLACEDRIALFHIALFPGKTPEKLMPPSLRAILESPEIYKVGVAVKGDFSRLRKYLDIQSQGVFELSRLHNLVELHAINPHKIPNKLVGLAAQVLQHLQLPLYKGEPLKGDFTTTANVRESDWSKPLDLQQIAYAAADAYAGFRLYHMLEWKRKQLRPIPPTRGLCDYDAIPKPKATPGKPKIPRNPKEVVTAVNTRSAPEVEQEEEDGYETAPEELIDSQELEDPMLLADAYKTASADGVRVQKRVGRVNSDWLRTSGPDPGYPTLPTRTESEDVEHSLTSTLQLDGSSRTFKDHTSVTTQLHVDKADDEFADPELEEALKVMELDVDGNLREPVGLAQSVIGIPVQRQTVYASSSLAIGADREQGDVEVGAIQEISEPEDLPDVTSALPNPLAFTSSASRDNTVRTAEYDLATTWAQNYFQSTIPSSSSTLPSRIRATTPHLRAYYLWHFQELSLDDIANHLRAPPLSHTTVISYILQAISLERLEYDKAMMKDALMELPTSLRKGRWKSIADKVGA